MSRTREFRPGSAARIEPEQESLSLVSRLADEMNVRWTHGERIRVEDYFAAHPELLSDPETALGLIHEELCLCEELAEPLELADLLRRFPQWEDQVRRLFECQSLLASSAGGPRFPECGEDFGPFRLIAELGRGMHGRVFLATEPKLANRPLVLKVTASSGSEHLSLARLQHTNIVPLYFVDNVAWLGLRALGMPFFGGASLERLLERIRERPLSLRTGQDIIEWLRAEGEAVPPELDPATASLEHLEAVSYANFICWIGVCVAEAIQYAHEKGMVHLDIKPSNVLLTADGEPMLLDFHLARESIPAGAPAPPWLGGTQRYMSPEQAAAFEAVTRGDAILQAVDERSDIYSLGILLYELLGGDDVSHSETFRTLAAIGRDTSVGLMDIIAKSLAPTPSGRYASAAGLAGDLHRHLANQPLQGVPNRSLGERWRKWRRRAPSALRNWGLLVGLVATLLVVAALAWDHVQQQQTQAAALRDEGRQLLADGHIALAQETLARGLQIVQATPGGRSLALELEQELRRAATVDLIGGLHRVMNELRNLYGFKPLPKRQVLDILPLCEAVWAHHDELLRHSQGILTPAEREVLQNDLLELAILWIDLRRRIATVDEFQASRAEILAILDEAEAIAAGSAVIAYERANLAPESVSFDVEQAIAAFQKKASVRGAWESFALGLALLNNERLPDASHCLSCALRLQPGSLWTQYYYGRCQYEMREYAEAARAFSACIALAPEHAGAYYNRALVFTALDEHDRALRDYDAALVLDPNLAGAVLNRGVLHYLQHDYAAAKKDLEHAVTLHADPIAANYNLAFVAVASGNPTDAERALRQVLERQPRHPGALKLLETLETKR